MNIDNIVSIQCILGRTQEGRVLSAKALEICKNGVDDSLEINECNTCGFVFSSDHFSGGCVNCGSQDFKKNIGNK
jgi:predicted Zn-ribbon and HTH transcriptional regulator